ncbi:MAG TPA: transcription termination/antitermination protein NusG [Patescibacteria group bacterium]|nr:transcription termination/antitermination protein NusG [Patescibacteria group bacterium]
MKKASSAVKNLSTEADQTEKTPMIAESNIGVPARLDSARLAKSVGKDKKFLTLKQTGEQNWYVIHTYSGYEEQVSESLKQRIESLNMEDKVFDIIVPKEKQIEIKNGKRKTIEKKIFPGYVFVDMIVTDDSWYVVRNTPNVTGFIGFGVRPTPVSKEEIDRIKKRMGVEEPKYQIDLHQHDLVKITDGALKGFEGKVEEVDHGKGKVKVLVNMFGRETPVNLDFLQVIKV